MKCNKSLCAIGAIIAIIIAIFCILPAFSYKECKKANPDHNYFAHCKEYWKGKFSKKDEKPAADPAADPSKEEEKPAEEAEDPEAQGKLQTVQPIDEE